MGEGRRIWPGMLCAAIVATGGLLARSDPTGTGLYDGRRPSDRSLRAGDYRASTGRRSSRKSLHHESALTAHHPLSTARARIAAHRHGQSPYPFPQESPRGSSCNVACHSSTPGEGICNTASAMDGGASAMMIPLDDPAPERTPASSWVSPPPPERAPGEPAP